ncbi:unnamed protein product [Sphacelaria rigidula]
MSATADSSAAERRRCNSAAKGSLSMSNGPSSRGEFAKNVVGGAALGLATLFTPTLTRPAAAVTASLDELTANIILAKEVFKPTLQYLKAEQFDAARTNTNYITNFLNIKKNIDALIVSASEFVDDVDLLEQAVDRAQEAQALFTNFDASVYTIIFIPADASGVLPPGAEKYLKQAYGFYDDINKLLDFYINLVPPEAREGANKFLPAKRAALPKFLFKEKSLIMQEKVSIS